MSRPYDRRCPPEQVLFPEDDLPPWWGPRALQSRLPDMLREYGPSTARELAELCRTNLHRTYTALYDCAVYGLVEVEGYLPNPRGRPTRIYRAAMNPPKWPLPERTD